MYCAFTTHSIPFIMKNQLQWLQGKKPLDSEGQMHGNAHVLKTRGSKLRSACWSGSNTVSAVTAAMLGKAHEGYTV